MASSASSRERVTALITPVVTAAGLELEDVVVTPAGRRSMVRVIVDSDHGVSLDAVAEVSRAMSAALDSDDDAMGSSPYVLEVSSPGVDRPLVAPRHWRRAIGRLVRVETPGASPVRGRVLRSDETHVVLEADGIEQTLAIGGTLIGRVEVEFTHREPATAAEPASEGEPE